MSIRVTDTEAKLLAAAPRALRDGIDLLQWWQATDPSMSYRHHYQETVTPNRPGDQSYGFFDDVRLASRDVPVTVPINGNVQEMFYDDPKSSRGKRFEKIATEVMHEQIREFILKYFMRVSDFRLPELADDKAHRKAGIAGFGFSQLFYKRRGTDEIGRFDKDSEGAIVELTEFEAGSDGEAPYEWIILKNPIFGFGFDFKPFGTVLNRLIGVKGPEIRIPADVFNYLVLSKDFIVNEEYETDPKDPNAVRARYGFGYAFVNNPEPSVYGYGPGELEPAFEQMVWEIRNSGEIRVRAAFVAQEPKSILKLSVDPLAWGFQFTKALGGELPFKPLQRVWSRLPLTNVTFDPVLPTVQFLNFMTGGQAARVGISKERIIKQALFVHFLQHYQTIVGSLQTWRQIRDWLGKTEPIPEWVHTGKIT
ncbi:MAG: hypothetical protein AAF560_14215 [Acidobacteriota bacterium]